MNIKNKSKSNFYLFAALILAVLLLVDLAMIKGFYKNRTLDNTAQGIYLSDPLTAKLYPSGKLIHSFEAPVQQLFSVQNSSYAANSTSVTWFDGVKSEPVKLPCEGQLSNFGQTRTGLVVLDTCGSKQFLSVILSPHQVKSVSVENVEAVLTDFSGYVVIKNGASNIGFWSKVPLGKDDKFSTRKAITQYGNIGGFYSTPSKGLSFWGTSLSNASYLGYSFKDAQLQTFAPPVAKGFNQLITFQSLQLSNSSVVWLSAVAKKSHPTEYHQQLIEDSSSGSKQLCNFPSAISQIDGQILLNADKTILAVPVKTSAGEQLTVLINANNGNVISVERTSAFAFID